MRTKWPFIWLPLVGLMACSVDMWLQPSGKHCGTSTWWCSHQGWWPDLWMMTLPLLVLLGRGSLAALDQLRQTYAVLRQMRQLPRCSLSEPVAALVAALELDRRLDVVQCATPEAFCYGFLRPRIYITSGLLNALSLTELEAVLRHERHHLRSYDPLRVLLWTVLSGVCWWLEDRAEHAHLLRELAADRAVIAEQGRKPLASALFKLLALPRPDRSAQPNPAISGLSVTDARIDQLVQPDLVVDRAPVAWQGLILPVLLVCTMLLCSVVMDHTGV